MKCVHILLFTAALVASGLNLDAVPGTKSLDFAKQSLSPRAKAKVAQYQNAAMSQQIESRTRQSVQHWLAFVLKTVAPELNPAAGTFFTSMVVPMLMNNRKKMDTQDQILFDGLALLKVPSVAPASEHTDIEKNMKSLAEYIPQIQLALEDAGHGVAVTNILKMTTQSMLLRSGLLNLANSSSSAMLDETIGNLVPVLGEFGHKEIATKLDGARPFVVKAATFFGSISQFVMTEGSKNADGSKNVKAAGEAMHKIAEAGKGFMPPNAVSFYSDLAQMIETKTATTGNMLASAAKFLNEGKYLADEKSKVTLDHVSSTFNILATLLCALDGIREEIELCPKQ